MMPLLPVFKRPGWIFLALILCLSLPAQADELVTLDTRPGVQVKVMVLTPRDAPKGVLIAYAGGRGTLELGSRFGKPFIGNYRQVFLVRNREQFVKAGYAVLLPDVPSDREGMNYVYRLNPKQLADTRAVVDYARATFGMAPWILGTSASSLTVASVAPALGGDIAGIVLTASVTAVPRNAGAYASHPEGTASANLAGIRVPALVVAHREDACELSPPADSEKIMERLTAAPRKQSLLFTGGSEPRSGPCFPLAPHGFLGIEDAVEKAIIEFIEQPGT